MKENEYTNRFTLCNVRIVLEDRIEEGSVVIANGLIERIDVGSKAESGADRSVIDGEGGYVLPGFIDMHVHGGFGADFMDASRDSYDKITGFHAANGTTTMLATTMTAPKSSIEAVLEAAAEYRSAGMPYAALHGVHLEGPFISEKWPGAQNPAYILNPQLSWMQEWAERWPGLISQLTLAPEKEGSAETIAWTSQNGIVTACGHTDALYTEIEAAADAGLSQAVHTYNAMRGLHHREPGTLGAVLTDNRIHAELIADGHHVHPVAIRLLVAAKPADKVILITDAMSAAGMPDGQYELGALPVIVKDGVARLAEGKALAGSSLTMIGAFRYMLANTSLSIPQISIMASGNAARQLRIDDRTGSIAVGKQADLILTDADLNVRRTWVQGRTVYTSHAS
ncbi:N-acetylglucosamine-6-phosphate deacetylase [Paenibacillus harenae]|uniref:N-acetylglucosamine-6-phosphate deacetylase n=1 Tax=Paenibacillus harenae TaxID=306543 RepID=UPI00279088DD|nr:N-acetylglucosamine-6-phosphate deacetylase [Paenibacillus harenae]MDQ0061211.1 N-acetylglucosamine-6-phosphate deacetylase [Paenibacillus harenae]